MKKSKKITAILLVMMLSLSLLGTACGGGGDTAGGGNDGANKKVYTWKVQGYAPAGTLQDGWGTDLCDLIKTMTDGQVVIEWYPVGAVVAANEMQNAIRDGILDGIFSITGNWKSMVPAAPLISSIPGSFSDPNDYLMYMKYGGGQEIWEEMMAPYNAVPMVGALARMEIFMWMNKEASTLQDFKGMKLRMMPIMGEILENKGLSVSFIPGNEVVPSLERKVLDGAEYGTRATDISYGFPDVAKYYATPGVHQPSIMVEFVVNQKKWAELPEDLQEKVKMACELNTSRTVLQSGYDDIEAVKLLEEKGVKEVQLDPAFVEEMATWVDEWMEENAKKDEFIKQINDSYKAWGKEWYPYKESTTLPYPDWAFE